MKITTDSKKRRWKLQLKTQNLCNWEREIYKSNIDGKEENKVGNHKYKVGKKENERKWEKGARKNKKTKIKNKK